jgi:hypothetical protein
MAKGVGQKGPVRIGMCPRDTRGHEAPIGRHSVSFVMQPWLTSQDSGTGVGIMTSMLCALLVQ